MQKSIHFLKLPILERLWVAMCLQLFLIVLPQNITVCTPTLPQNITVKVAITSTYKQANLELVAWIYVHVAMQIILSISITEKFADACTNGEHIGWPPAPPHPPNIAWIINWRRELMGKINGKIHVMNLTFIMACSSCYWQNIFSFSHLLGVRLPVNDVFSLSHPQSGNS